MAPRSHDRLDFYRKNRDYSRLLDESGALEDEPEEEAVDDDKKSGKYRKSEPDEDPKAKRERQEYVERREKLKELERQKLKQKFAGVYGRKTNSSKHDNGNQNSRFGENISDKDKKKMLPRDDFGSFFGPSQPAIARRVIVETRARLEVAHVAAKVSRDAPETKKISVPASDAKSEYKKAPVVVNEAKKKAQRLKEARDYSFLFSEDTEMPDCARRPPETRNVASSRPDDSRSKQVIPKNSMALKKPIPTSKPISHATKEVKNIIAPARQMPTKADTKKVSPILNVKASADSKKQLSKVASGSGRSVQKTDLVRHSVSNSKVVVSVVRDKKETPSISGIKVGKNVHQHSLVSRPPSVQKTLPLKNPTNKPHTELRRPPALPKSPPPKPATKPTPKPALKPAPKPAPKAMPKPSPKPVLKLASKPILKPAPKPAPKQALMSAPKSTPKAIPKMASRPQAKPVSRDLHHERSKKRPRPYDSDEDLDGGGNYSSIIRQLFRYDPNKYKDIDDEDDSDMEVGFSTIQAEERRSERIAREEDERELALIEAEERAERARAKKRKLKHSQG